MLDRISLPRMRVGLSGIIRKAWEKRMESQLQLNSYLNNFAINFPEMPRRVADLVEGGPAWERGSEKVASASSRKLTGWAPTVRVAWGSCAVMRTGDVVGSPRPHQSWSWVWVSDPGNLHLLGQLFQWSPLQVGQSLGGGLCLPWGHCPLKWPSLPQWKEAPHFCFCLPPLEP